MIRPKQSLGQNFLRDDNISRKIVEAVNPHRSDVVLEIGPGEGALTKFLAPRLEKLIVVDIDKRVIDLLHERYPAGEIEVLHADVLALAFTDILDRRRVGRLRVVGNIPYNITSPILFHLLDNRRLIADATLMMQREVARRLVASPHSKDYGILAVSCQMFADVRVLFDVSPKCFYPAPNVTSSVVQLRMLDRPRFPLADEAQFRAMVRAVFGKRRKTLRNSLAYYRDSLPPLSGFDLSQRPEQLSLAELAALANALAAQG